MALIDPDEPRTHRVSQPWGASLRLKKKIPDRDSVVVEQNSNLDQIRRAELDGSHWAHLACLGRNVSAPRRGMRPAGISGLARWVAPVRGNDVKGRSAIRPLSVEAVEFSPALVPEKNLTDDLGDRGQCFSCGFLGHGVNRCSQLDRYFPY